MKKTKLLFEICTSAYLLICISANAQNIGINTAGATPDASAMLDIVSTNKGLLIPRVALTATNSASPITAPANSLQVYNTATASTGSTAVYPGYYYWNGTQWVAFAGTGGLDWSLLGNAGTSGGPNFLGTTDNVSLRFRTNNTEKMIIDSTGNVGIGITAPARKLHVLEKSIFAFCGTNAGKSWAPPEGIVTITTGGDGTFVPTPDGLNPIFRVGRGGCVTGNPINEVFRVNLNGNVGIGTTAPDAKLDVAGTIINRNSAGTLSVQKADKVQGAGGNFNNLRVTVALGGWCSYTYKIQVAGQGSTAFQAGGGYTNSMLNFTHAVSVGSGFIVTSPSNDVLQFDYTGAPGWHPICVFEITGGGSQSFDDSNVIITFY